MKVVFELDVQLEDAIRKVADLTTELDTQKKAMKTLKESNMQNSEEYVNAARKASELKEEIKGYNSIVSQSAKIATSKTGSMKELSSELAINKQRYRELSEAERNNAAVGGALLKTIAEQDAEIKKLDSSIGNHQRNVGDYIGAVKAAEMGLGEMRKELLMLRNVQGASAEETKKIELRMGELTDAMTKAQARIKTHAMDALPALVGSLQDVVAASQLVIGAFGSMGGALGMNEEKTRKLQATMVQLIGITQALTTMQQRWAAGAMQANFIKTAMVIKTAALTAATKVATAAQWLWNVALTANPIGIIIAAIVAFIAGIAALAGRVKGITQTFKDWWEMIKAVGQLLGIVKKDTGELSKETETLAEQQERLNKALTESEALFTVRSKYMNHEINLLKAKGKNIDEIKAKERELILFEIENMGIRVKMMQDLIKNTKGVTAEQMNEYTQLNEAWQQAKRDLQIFDAEQKTRRKKEEEDKKKEARKPDPRVAAHKKAIEDAEKFVAKIIELGQTERQKSQAKYDGDLKDLQALHDKKLISEAQYIAAKKVINDNWEAYLKETETQEMLDYYALNVLRATTDQQVYEAKRAELQKQMQVELQMLTEGTNEYARVHQEYLNKISELDKAQSDKAIQAEKEFNSRLLDLKIENAQELTDWEALQREKLEEQKQADILAAQEQMAQDLITKDQFEMMKFEIERSYAEKAAALDRHVTQERLNNYSKFIGAAKGLSASLMQLEIDNAGDSEAEKKRIKKKYANINAAISLGETAIATAQGMMGATAAMPGPAGMVLAALVGIMGVAQAALIMSERSKIQGLYTGGYVTRAGMFRVGERGAEDVYLPQGASVYPNSVSFGSAIPGVPQIPAIQDSGMSSMAEMMQGFQPVVTVEEINMVSNQFNNRVKVAEL